MQVDGTDVAKALLAAVFEVPVRDVPDTAAIDNFERWDSLGHVQVLTALETRIGRSLTTEESLSVRDLPSLRRLLQQR